MSPEQIRGEHPDHRADIYSLGVMLYEMVSGKPPYESDSAMTIMMMHLNDPIPDVAALAPGTPPGLNAVIARALAKDPDQRYQSAGEMAAAIRGALSASAAAPAGTVVESPGPAATYVEPAPPKPPAPQATYVEPAGAQPPPPGAMTGEGGPVYRPSPPAPQPAKKRSNSMLLIGGGGVVILLLICIIAAVLFLPDLLGGGLPGLVSEPTETEAVAIVDPTDTPVPEATTTSTATAPPTSTPTITPSPTITPTPTATQPEGPYVLITDITLENGVYYVYYEWFNFTPLISTNSDSMHIHFFWDTVEVTRAGVGNGIGESTGGGSWALYDLPTPFTQYAASSRPNGATQICARVAYYDHSIDLDTGNCFDLPE
jgi:serine/threonine-protein kinase